MHRNGQPVPGLSSFSLEPTGSWGTWKEATLPGRIAIQAGLNVLRLTCLNETSLCLSRVRLFSPGKEDVVIDATRLSAQGGGQAQVIVPLKGGYFRHWDDTGHWLEWTIRDAPAGSYKAFMRYATMYESPRELRVNGQVAEGLESFTMGPSRGWTNWVEAPLPAPVPLRQGRNVLRMTSLGGHGLNLNAIRLSSPGKRDITVQAIGFTGQGGGNVKVNGPSRHGSLYGWDDRGHWLEWTIDGAAAGDYEVALRYATEARPTREMRLNAQPVEGLDSFALEPTGGWQTWRETTLPGRIALRQGRNTLRMTNLGGRGLNLDEITLSPRGRQ
jgi:hypothetical protein